ncbi:MAG: hypothetical protein SFZ03_00720 [Candidatus Melainabacteria bacterium]|nr:hypothetical protein [Candidatus Melainabacteria bacterium]
MAPVVPAATNTLATTYVATYAAPSPRIASPNYPTQWVALPGAQPITGSTPGMSHQAFSLPERDVFTVDSQDALRQAYVQSAAPLVQSMAEKSDRYAELAEKHPVTALTTSTILFGLGVVAALSAARMALIGLMMNGVKRLCYEVPWIKAQITEPVARLFGNRVALWGLGLGLSSAVAFSIHEQLKQVASGASVLGSSSTPGSTGQIQPSTTSIETH